MLCPALVLCIASPAEASVIGTAALGANMGYTGMLGAETCASPGPAPPSVREKKICHDCNLIFRYQLKVL